MRKRLLLLAVACSPLVAAAVSANPVWRPDYPKAKAGRAAGTVEVAGTITLKPPLRTTGEATVQVWPAEGGLVTEVKMPIAKGKSGAVKWGPFTMKGVPAGAKYEVVVTIQVRNADTKEVETYAVAPKTVTVPAIR